MAYYTDVHGAALLIGISESAVYARLARGKLPFRRFGKHYLVAVAELSKHCAPTGDCSVEQALKRLVEGQKEVWEGAGC